MTAQDQSVGAATGTPRTIGAWRAKKRFRWNAAGASFWLVATVPVSGDSRDSPSAMTARSNFVLFSVRTRYCRRHGNGPNGASPPITSSTRSREFTRIITFVTSGTGRVKELYSHATRVRPRPFSILCYTLPGWIRMPLWQFCRAITTTREKMYSLRHWSQPSRLQKKGLDLSSSWEHNPLVPKSNMAGLSWEMLLVRAKACFASRNSMKNHRSR